MATNIDLLSLRNNVQDAFKSLMKSGRSDIFDKNDVNISTKLYVDLFNNDYALEQVLDDNHLILKGRRGTGKSTIFVCAEQKLNIQKNSIPIYINLQTIYEQLNKINKTDEVFKDYLIYKNFMEEILKKIISSLPEKIFDLNKNKNELEMLLKVIKEGTYYDSKFKNSIELSNVEENKKNVNLSFSNSLKGMESKIGANIGESSKNTSKETIDIIRVFSANEILTKLSDILLDINPNYKVYLFLDDFSELEESHQTFIVDGLISPIISSYSKVFKVKIATYPNRVYMGNIDQTKIPTLSLDFYYAFKSQTQNAKYTEIESMATEYVKRTIEKRIEYYTNNQMMASDLFDTNNVSIEEYYKTLFYATDCIPRTLGFILNYCYLSSINNGEKITLSHINNASAKYFENNILSDFQNDVRFKQSFYDDSEILSQFAQINLMEKLIDKSKEIKSEVVKNTPNNKIIFENVLSKNKKGNQYWFPTSHFFINKSKEKLLHTLELYFIVTKYNQGSSKSTKDTESFYALNYGLCVYNKIDFGRPEGMRDSYDFWRQLEFNFNDFIPQALSSIEEIVCIKCGHRFNDVEFEMCIKFGHCLKCSCENSVQKINVLGKKIESKIDEWSNKKLPDIQIAMLRVLFNQKETKLSAFEIASELDKHHISITHAGNKLKELNYIGFTTKDGKRYYYILDSAITTFFTST